MMIMTGGAGVMIITRGAGMMIMRWEANVHDADNGN